MTDEPKKAGLPRGCGLVLLAVGIVLLLVLGIAVAVAVNQKGDAEVIIGFACFACVGLALIIWAVRILRNTKPAAPPTAPTTSGFDERGDLDGLPYSMHFTPAVAGKHPQPSQFRVQIDTGTAAQIVFNRETGFDRFCKRMGIAREFQSGHEEFDQTVYVRGAEGPFVETLLESDARREAILALLGIGFTEVKFDPGVAVASWRSFEPRDWETREVAMTAAGHLRTLTTGLPAETDADRGPPPFKAKLAVLYTGAGLLAATAALAFVFPPCRWGLFIAYSLGAFVGFYLFFAVFSAILLRGTARSHDHWATAMVIGFFLILIGSFGGVATLNGAFDPGPVKTHDQVIVSKRESRGRKGGTNYYVKVADWNNPGETKEFSVGSSEYSQIIPNKTRMQLKISHGLLGIEWVEKKTLQFR